MLHSAHAITIGLSLRVATVAFVTAVFSVFVAEYAHLRAELTEAERQLNLSESGRLATTHLGRAVAREGLEAALLASGASFLGAIIPLLIAAALPRTPWCAFVVAIVGLGVLGGALARSVNGSFLRWVVILAICGCLVAFVGVELKIT